MLVALLFSAIRRRQNDRLYSMVLLSLGPLCNANCLLSDKIRKVISIPPALQKLIARTDRISLETMTAWREHN